MNTWDIYEEILRGTTAENREASRANGVDSFFEAAASSANFHPKVMVNGVPIDLLVIRTKATLITLTAQPDSRIFPGDYVELFDETWLVIESKVDVYGIITAEAWLCNHLFRMQNFNGDLIERFGVVDTGSYSKNRDEKIPVVNGEYTIYLPEDTETNKIYVDKRFAFGVVKDSEGKDILEVYKVAWIDTRSKNLGRGSHLYMMKLVRDVYDAQVDNRELMLCDYKHKAENINTDENFDIKITITGRDTIKIGTTRSFGVMIKDNSEKNVTNQYDIKWEMSCAEDIKIVTSGEKCEVCVPLKSELIGSVVSLAVSINDKKHLCEKIVEVTSLG